MVLMSGGCARCRGGRRARSRRRRRERVAVGRSAEALAGDERDQRDERDAATPHGNADEALRRSSASASSAGGRAAAVAEFRAGRERRVAGGAGRAGERSAAVRAEFSGGRRAAGGQGNVASGCRRRRRGGSECGEPERPCAKATRPSRSDDAPIRSPRLRSRDDRPAARSARPCAGAMRVFALANDVGLRDDADERAALVDDRDAPHLLGAHRLHHVVDVVALVQVASSSELMTSRTRHVPSLPSATQRMAMSRSVTTPTSSSVGLPVDDRHDADVFALHHLRGLANGRVRR